MSLAQYLKSFSRIRTYKDRKKWSALTTYQAPHKAFLLLSIMDMIAQGSIFENFIGPRFRVDGLAKDYEVLLSKRVVVAQNFPGHILTLTDRPIFTPEKENFWPDQDNLHWHRRNTCRR